MRRWIDAAKTLAATLRIDEAADWLKHDLYHGTARRRLAFSPTHVAYLTPDLRTAWDHAKMDAEVDGGTPLVLRVRLSIENPVRLDTREMQDLHANDDLVARLQAQGYDSAIGEHDNEVAVFGNQHIHVVEIMKQMLGEARERDESGGRRGHSYQEFLDSQQTWVGIGIAQYQGMQARQIAEHELDRRNDLIAALKTSDLASHIRLFGSATRGGIPGDIDAFVDEHDLPPEVSATAILLPLMKRYWPLLDAFVLTRSQGLWCHSEASRATGVQWVKAKGANQQIAAGRAGVPLASFTGHYALPDGLVDPPAKGAHNPR